MVARVPALGERTPRDVDAVAAESVGAGDPGVLFGREESWQPSFGNKFGNAAIAAVPLPLGSSDAGSIYLPRA